GDIGNAGRPERRQVASDQFLERRLDRGRSPEPVFGRRPGWLTALPPDTAWRHLDDRDQVTNHVGERRRVTVRPLLLEQFAELRKRARFLLQPHAGLRDHRAQVDANQVATERRALQRAFESRGKEGIYREAVTGCRGATPGPS